MMQGMRGFKTSKTLLGIETDRRLTFIEIKLSFKTSKTLLGIETEHQKRGALHMHLAASKPLKPF